jgi:hypothetical protein
MGIIFVVSDYGQRICLSDTKMNHVIKQIDGVEKEIGEVGKEIKTTEASLGQAKEDKECVRLEKKLEHLRQEKNNLQQKEHDLQQKENLLLKQQGEAKATDGIPSYSFIHSHNVCCLSPSGQKYHPVAIGGSMGHSSTADIQRQGDQNPCPTGLRV